MMSCCFTDCLRPVYASFFEFERRKLTRESQFCFEHGEEYAKAYPWSQKSGIGTAGECEGAVCFDIELIFIEIKEDPNYWIYLREVQGNRIFSFFTGETESSFLLALLRYPTGDYPHVHQTMASVIDSLGGKVECALVDTVKVQDGIPMFSARVHISQGEKRLMQSIRITDALALAIAAQIPFFVAKNVLLAAPQR